jgi:hypothetical protein
MASKYAKKSPCFPVLGLFKKIPYNYKEIKKKAQGEFENRIFKTSLKGRNFCKFLEIFQNREKFL